MTKPCARSTQWQQFALCSICSTCAKAFETPSESQVSWPEAAKALKSVATPRAESSAETKGVGLMRRLSSAHARTSSCASSPCALEGFT